MTEEEAHKINELFRQIDTLTAENRALKDSSAHDHSSLEDKLASIENKLDKLLDKGTAK